MSYLVYITDDCREMASNYSVLGTIETLANKIESDQSISSWDRFLPDPAIRKSLGRSFRLVAIDKIFEDYNIITFIGVWPRSSSEYNKFINGVQEFVSKYEPSDESYRTKINERKQGDNKLPTLIAPNSIEYGYLFGNVSGLDEENMIFESSDWVSMIKDVKYQETISRYYDLLSEEILDSIADKTTVIHKQSGAKIIFKRFPSIKCIILIAPLIGSDLGKEQLLINKYEKILNVSEDQISIEDICKYSSRSYPEIILADEEQTWYKIEKNSEGNLALSPEESTILKSVTSPEKTEERYPLFINGRPGSGKSTILQYLFAEHLFLHLSKEMDERLDSPPLYLTYSEQLLNVAKETVKTMLKCNSKLIAYKKIDIDSPGVQEVIDNSFGEFHRYMLNHVPEDVKETIFKPEKYIHYSTFRREWNKYKRTDPEQKIRRMSPELVWHVIRTFIKGMSDINNDCLDVEAYEELSKEQQSVSIEIYRIVYEKVWNKWYKPLCEEKGYWDNQDLTLEVLKNLDREQFANYPAIICDEAQDFTRNELELILNLSVFSRRALGANELARVPFAFAGDPYQTLNPTGFNWNSVSSGFHEKIVKNLDRTSSGRLKMNYKELAYNYRSSKDVVGFTNLIQLLRGLLFDIKNLKPQRAWFGEESIEEANSSDTGIEKSRPLQYYDLDSEACKTMLSEREDLIIILPCQEGEEEEYVNNDYLLSSITKGNYYARNFLSPMQAKGLEFNTVVLYKFGEDIADNYDDLLVPLVTNKMHQGEEALPLEYFMNRLYVAVSRAKKNLLLIDTKRGIERVWKNESLVNLDSLITAYNSKTNVNWSIKDLTLVEPGIDASLDDTSSEDNPLDIAEAFRTSGMSEENAYFLRMSANNYRRANREHEALKCEAYAYVYEGNYKEAGLIFAKIKMKNDALENLWKSEALDVIADDNLFIDTIYQKASIFLKESKKTLPEFKACQNIVLSIVKTYSAEPFLFKGEYTNQWRKALDEIIKCIITIDYAQMELNANNLIEWEILYKDLMHLNLSGLIALGEQNHAELAFRAGYYSEAIKIWGKADKITHTNYYIAKSKTIPFPDNVVWLLKGDVRDELVRIIKDHLDNINKHEITEDSLMGIINIFIQEGLLQEALIILKSRPNYEKLRFLFEEIKKTKGESLQRDVLELLIKEGVAGGKWDDIINYYDKQEFDVSLINHANKTLVLNLANSEEFVNASNKRKGKIGEYLRKIFIENKWKGIVDVKTAGASIENANKVIDALEFYEMIWKTGDIEASNLDIIEAKKRWLKRKYILGKMNKTQKHRIEADEMNEQWKLNVEIDMLPYYPGFVDTKVKKRNVGKENISKKQEQAIFACQIQGMNIKDIAEVLAIKHDVVKAFLEENSV